MDVVAHATQYREVEPQEAHMSGIDLSMLVNSVMSQRATRPPYSLSEQVLVGK